MTGYCPTATCYEWGKADIGRIYQLCHAHDQLQSKWSKKEIRHRKRYKMKRAARRIRKKIRNIVKDIHHKLGKWLCTNFSYCTSTHPLTLNEW